jgi:hypothetical protein
MTGHNLSGNSMDDYPLTLTSIIERAERFHTDREVVSRRPSGVITRTTYGSCARRARQLAGALPNSVSAGATWWPPCCGTRASTRAVPRFPRWVPSSAR